TWFCFFVHAEYGIRASSVTGVQTCALPIFALEDTGLFPPGAAGRATLDGETALGGKRPVSSSAISSNGVNASCTSATSTRSAPKPAIANAALAAAWVARKLVSS